MAVVTIIYGMLGIGLIAIGGLIITPVAYSIYNSENLTCGVDVQCNTTKNTIYQVTLASPLLFLGAAFLNMYARAARRQTDEVWTG